VLASPPTNLLIPQLRAVFNGKVIAPDDAEYDAARTIFYKEYERRPAAIVRVADSDDVSRVISLARESGHELAVRSGGHSVAGHSSSEGGIVLDLSDMRAMEIDRERRTAWAETGLTTGEYTVAASAHGLATPFGDTGSVGIGGLTLGGGIGFLVRKHGMTIDDLLAAEVVTADAEVLHVDSENHADLFWAIRGGGGNFGVATRLQFRLHELENIVGGTLILPATPEVIESFIAEAAAAPDELSTIATVMPAPPLPFVPEEHHGRLVVFAQIAYAGAAEDGQRAVAPLKALADPIADMVRPMAYPELFPPEDPDYRPVAVSRTMFVDRIDRRIAETILDHLEASTAPMRVTQLRVLGGAMSRVPADATAFAHRERPIMANVAALYQRPDERAEREAWVVGLTGELTDGDESGYVGFLGDEGGERVRAAYPGPSWHRLQSIKARYDPDNLFRRNQNIPPAS
jgi:FAD/FMN-containing dehydrogenase